MNAEILFNEGYSCYENKEFKKAILHYEKALALNPNNCADILFEIAECKFDLEEYEDALMDLNKAFEIVKWDPDQLKQKCINAISS